MKRREEVGEEGGGRKTSRKEELKYMKAIIMRHGFD